MMTMLKKLIFTALVMSLVLFNTAKASDEELEEDTQFHGEFFRGMEDGFFLRDEPSSYKAEGCEEPKMDVELLKAINAFYAPIHVIVGIMKNPIVDAAQLGIEIFVESSVYLLGAVKDYDGTEYCSGLLFGSHGTALLLKVAKGILTQIENLANQEVKSTPKRVN